MTTATRSIDVNVPLQVAYNQWTQMESYPRFMAAVKSVEQLDDTHTSWHMSMGGVTREFTAEITEQIPDERICWTAEGELKHAGEVSFAAVDDDVTRVELTIDWEPEGVAENLASAFMVDDEMVEADLQAFKRLIESQGFAEGAWRGTVEDTPGGTSVTNGPDATLSADDPLGADDALGSGSGAGGSRRDPAWPSPFRSTIE